MTHINFITNQALERESGGWCGISRGIFQALARKAKVTFVGPVDPGVSAFQKLNSKVRRTIGLRGDFYFFSDWRLSKINNDVLAAATSADFDLYFGATPWLSCDLRRPYGTYIDALFPTYLRIFGKATEFREADLARIRRREEYWLRDASHIFWTSDWARLDGARYEDLANVSNSVVGVGGNIEPPSSDSYSGEKRLLFISMRFLEKGGIEAFNAFVQLQKRVPDLRLIIIGEPPPDFVANHPSVEVVGLLDKGNPANMQRFQQELSRAFCLVHPTRMDTMGCVLIEAAYWGCPAIAPTRFGIPEIINDKVTGMLLPEPFTVEHIIGSIESMLGQEDGYIKMRAAARSRALGLFTYDVIADKMLAAIEKSLRG